MPLAGWQVLVPRIGPWGERVGALLASRGAVAVLASLIAYERPLDPEPLKQALERLAAGHFDWLMVTSATTADVLTAERARIPASTRVAAVGEATARALRATGIDPDFTQRGEASAVGLVEGWQATFGGDAPSHILVLRSDLAPATVSDGLTAHGHTVDVAVAYSTVGPDLDPNVIADVRGGKVDAILLTSGSVARSLARQLAPIPATVVLASIGPRTTAEATEAGLDTHVTSPVRDVESLIQALEHYAETPRVEGKER